MTGILSKYLNRQLQYPAAANPFSSEKDILIVIPAYKEENLVSSINALYQCNKAQIRVGIIIHINRRQSDSEHVVAMHERAKISLRHFLQNKESSAFQVALLETMLPEKDAGVGLARKIGMDCAVRCFSEWNNPKGVIACFDADSTCTPNYIQTVFNGFNQKKINGASIYFEHPLQEQQDINHVKAITRYELHLRYLVQGFRYAGVRQAFHAVGSSMAVTAEAYTKQGGMNKRQAGEDFYFMQKIVNLGSYTELNDTTVFPSSRISDRVPFGTGRAMMEIFDNKNLYLNSYDWNNFVILKQLLSLKESLYRQPERVEKLTPMVIKPFMEHIHFLENSNKIKNNCTSYTQFHTAFHQWFDGFKAMKAMHYLRDHIKENTSLLQNVNYLFEILKGTQTTFTSHHEALLALRQFERTHSHLEV